MVVSNRLGGVKEAGALLLIANPLTLEDHPSPRERVWADGLANQR
jgi:hypothetical protein